MAPFHTWCWRFCLRLSFGTSLLVFAMGSSLCAQEKGGIPFDQALATCANTGDCSGTQMSQEEAINYRDFWGPMYQCAAGWGCENTGFTAEEANGLLGTNETEAQQMAEQFGYGAPPKDALDFAEREGVETGKLPDRSISDVLLECAAGFECSIEGLTPEEAAKQIPPEDGALQCASGYGCENTPLTKENAKKLLGMGEEEAKAEFDRRVASDGGQIRPYHDEEKEGYEFSEKDLSPEDLSNPISPEDMAEIFDKAPKDSWGEGPSTLYEKCITWMLRQPWLKVPAYQAMAIQHCKEAATRGTSQLMKDWEGVQRAWRENGINR